MSGEVHPAVRWGVLLAGIVVAAAIGYAYGRHAAMAEMEDALVTCYNIHIAGEIRPSTQAFETCVFDK